MADEQLDIRLEGGGPFARYVLLGAPPRIAEHWLKARRIDRARAVVVRDPRIELARLRGVSGKDTALVWFGVPGGKQPAALAALRKQGAVDVASIWWPPREGRG